MLRAQALSAVRGGDPLFQNVSLTVRRGDRVALVGPNGAGKTTILSFLSGEQEPDGGRVTLDDGSTLTFLHQEERAGTGTVWEEVTRGIGPILTLEREMAELADRLDDPDAFDRWAAVEEEFGRIGGYDYRHREEGDAAVELVVADAVGVAGDPEALGRGEHVEDADALGAARVPLERQAGVRVEGGDALP